jgi:DNA-binding NarL/FixJ family response regulator
MDHKKPLPGSIPPLDSLLENLGLLLAQARAYERILPADNYPARAAVAVLSELARKALNEAQTVADTLASQAAEDHPFSPREFQVLKLAAHGLTNREIAYRLAISERTVQFHMNSIFNKTGTFSRTEAVALAIHNHWLTNEPE